MKQSIAPNNKGLIIESLSEKDYVFGAVERSLDAKFAGREPLAPNGDWSRYMPVTEPQNVTYETNACVSFSFLSAIEFLKKRLYDKSSNLSDRFVAKISGTNPSAGNTPRNVGDAIRKNWSCFEEEYPMSIAKSIIEFYQEIPKNLIQLATGRGAEYDFGYEFVKYENMKEAIKFSPLLISVPAWFKDKNNKFYRPEGVGDGHLTVCYNIDPNNGDMYIFDSYYPFLKILRSDVKPQVILGIYLNRQVKNDSFWSLFLEWLEAIFVGEKRVHSDDELTNTEKNEPVPQPTPVRDNTLIETWAEAIKQFEGWHPGSKAYRNNNPGNIKGLDGNFLVFKTPEEGYAYLVDYLTRACTGKHKAYSPEMTLIEFFRVYAPDPEPIPSNYAAFVASKMAVTTDRKIKTFV